MENKTEFMSLYEYRNNKKDTDGTGKRLYNFARSINAPISEKIVPHSAYNGGRIFTYPKQVIESFFNLEKYINQ
jgi:hypothetical protein